MDFKEALTRHIHAAVMRLLNKGFDEFRTQYIGYIVTPASEGKSISGHAYRVTNTETGENEMVLLQDNGEILGFREEEEWEP